MRAEYVWKTLEHNRLSGPFIGQVTPTLTAQLSYAAELTFSTGTIHVLLTVGTLPLQTWPARLWRKEDDASVWVLFC